MRTVYICIVSLEEFWKNERKGWTEMKKGKEMEKRGPTEKRKGNIYES